MRIKNNLNIQTKIDRIIDKLFLGFIPYKVKPNHVTIVRFILIPIIYLLLKTNHFAIALIVFIIAASTDFIDGAMARTRNQITDLGKTIDPIADKLLIMSILLYIGFDYLVVKIFVIFIILEIISVLSGALLSFAIGRPTGANLYGKIKMALQCFSVGLFFLGVLINNLTIINLSLFLLAIALFFALLAGIEVFRTKTAQIKQRRYNRRNEQQQ